MKTPRRTLVATLAGRMHGADATQGKELAAEIAAFMLAEHRTGELDSLLRDIQQQRAQDGVVEVTAISAHALDDAVRADIEQEVRALYPAARQIIISHRLDASVVGGVRLEFADRQLDLSVRSKLNRLKQLTA